MNKKRMNDSTCNNDRPLPVKMTAPTTTSATSANSDNRRSTNNRRSHSMLQNMRKSRRKYGFGRRDDDDDDDDGDNKNGVNNNRDREASLSANFEDAEAPVLFERTSSDDNNDNNNRDIEDADADALLSSSSSSSSSKRSTTPQPRQTTTTTPQQQPAITTPLTTTAARTDFIHDMTNKGMKSMETYIDSYNVRRGEGGGGGAEEEEEEDDAPLREDIYSLLYTSKPCSLAFVFATFVTMLQNGLLWLILYGLIDLNSANNAIRLPPGVPVSVNIAQFLGVVLIVYTVAIYGDLTSGMHRLIDGYHYNHVIRQSGLPYAYTSKWLLAGILQIGVGLAMTMDLFILMMQSTEVVGLCLNFAALHFVQEIDDLAFLVGKHGFMTKSIRQECLFVCDVRVPSTSADKLYKGTRLFFRQMFTLTLSIALIVPYFILIKRQWDGQYVCQNVYVQFGDAYIPEMAYFSGAFAIAKTTSDNEAFSDVFARKDFRTVYYDRTKSLQLAYCDNEQAWVFAKYNDTSHCNFILKSSTTTTFDVTTVASDTWYTWKFDDTHIVPTDWFAMSCNDCNGNTGVCPSDAGTCENNECICHSGRMGNNCEFDKPSCDTLGIDARTEPLPLEEGVTFPENYNLLRFPPPNNNTLEPGQLVQVHDRPVYVSQKTQPEYANTTDFLLFSGRRWVIFALKSQLDDDTFNGTGNDLYSALAVGLNFEEADNITSVKDLEDTLSLSPVHQYRPYFFSEAVDVGTPMNVLEPTDLNWYRAKPYYGIEWHGWQADGSQSLEVKFLCSECNEKTNPCYNGATCDPIQSKCVCPRFYTGSLCEHALRCDTSTGTCLNNGTCDTWRGYCDCYPPYYGNLCQFVSEPIPPESP